jgi:hypothetical protein
LTSFSILFWLFGHKRKELGRTDLIATGHGDLNGNFDTRDRAILLNVFELLVVLMHCVENVRRGVEGLGRGREEKEDPIIRAGGVGAGNIRFTFVVGRYRDVGNWEEDKAGRNRWESQGGNGTGLSDYLYII